MTSANNTPRPSRLKTAIVSVRFTPEELAVVQRRAQEKGLLISTFLRESALGEGETRIEYRNLSPFVKGSDR